MPSDFAQGAEVQRLAMVQLELCDEVPDAPPPHQAFGWRLPWSPEGLVEALFRTLGIHFDDGGFSIAGGNFYSEQFFEVLWSCQFILWIRKFVGCLEFFCRPCGWCCEFGKLRIC